MILELQQIKHQRAHPFMGLKFVIKYIYRASENWNGAAGNNKYAYNGKEWNDDFGLGWNDYGARFYDPTIARWSVIDPLGEMRANVSPYQYVQNNPMNRIDPTGMLDKSSGGGADGLTNTQWVSYSNPANRGSEAASSAYNGSRNALKSYETSKANAERRATTSQNRPITDDDLAGSFTFSPYGTRWYRGGELLRETVEGYNLVESIFKYISPESFRFYSVNKYWQEAYTTNLKFGVTILSGPQKGYAYIEFSLTIGAPIKLSDNRDITGLFASQSAAESADKAVLIVGRRIGANPSKWLSPLRFSYSKEIAQAMEGQMQTDTGWLDLDSIPGARVQVGDYRQNPRTKPQSAIYKSVWDFEF